MVLKKIGILISRGGLLHPRTMVQDSDAIRDIQGIDVRVRVRVLDLHLPLQDAMVLFPPHLIRQDLPENLKLVSIHVRRA